MLANAGGMTWLDARGILFQKSKQASAWVSSPLIRTARTTASCTSRSAGDRWRTTRIRRRIGDGRSSSKWITGRSGNSSTGPAGREVTRPLRRPGRAVFVCRFVCRTRAIDGFHGGNRPRVAPLAPGFSRRAAGAAAFGPAEEEGLAVATDGSIITSIGTAKRRSELHDVAGRPSAVDRRRHHRAQRVLTRCRFSSRRQPTDIKRRESPASAPELWTTELATGRSELRLPAVGMDEYDISADGKQIVFTIRRANAPSELWIGPMDRSAEPETNRRGRRGCHLLRRIRRNPVPFHDRDRQLPRAHGTRRIGATEVVDYPIGTVQSISPDRRWLVAITPEPDGERTASMAIPTSEEHRGGSARRVRQRLVTRRPIVLRPDSAIAAARPDGHSYRERRDRAA